MFIDNIRCFVLKCINCMVVNISIYSSLSISIYILYIHAFRFTILLAYMYTHGYYIQYKKRLKLGRVKTSSLFIEFQQNPYIQLKTNNWTPSKYAF